MMNGTLISEHTVNEGETAFSRYVADNLTKFEVYERFLRTKKQISYRFQTAEISSIEGACNTSCWRSKTLKQERDPEGVETQVHKVLNTETNPFQSLTKFQTRKHTHIDACRFGPCVVSSERPRNDRVAELSSGLVDAEKLEWCRSRASYNRR